MVHYGKASIRGWNGRYVGPRVNCEYVPCLPAGALSWVLDDPRQVPYLMVWRDEDSGRILLASRVTAYTGMNDQELEVDGGRLVEIKGTDGRPNWILTIERPLPRNEGKARILVCPRCQRPRRALYPWKLNPARPHAVFTSTWQCRSCARLRYASEGGALLMRSRVFGTWSSDRPDSWYPFVFSSPDDAIAARLWTQAPHSDRGTRERPPTAALPLRP
jgi:hypothetical protein